MATIKKNKRSVKKAPIGALLPLAAKALPAVGKFLGSGAGKGLLSKIGGQMGGQMLGSLLPSGKKKQEEEAKRGRKIKKAQTGRKITETIPVSDTSGNTKNLTSGVENAKIKSKSSDKKYVSKYKTDASGNVTKLKSRRTLKGFLTGAPNLKKNLKRGGKLTKASVKRVSKKK